MEELSKEEIIELFDQFLNEHSQFYVFKEWLEEKGYTLAELGIKED